MSIEQTNTVDFVTVDEKAERVVLTISDHLGWEEDEQTHLLLLQDKLNAYLQFIESGEMVKKFPQVKGRSAVISVVGKFPLSAEAIAFFENAKTAVRDAGFSLEFVLFRAS